MSMSGTTIKGNVYMLLDVDNFECVGIDEFISIAELPITYGYLS